MNDHVHALLRPVGTHKLEEIVHSLKSFTAKQIRRQSRVGGKVWQNEYFDRVVRDQREFKEKAAYILNNPLKRWPEWEDYPWVGFEADGVGDD